MLSRPLPVALVVTAVMLVAGLPFLRAELTRADARVLPKETSAFVVDKTIREEFSADPSDPLHRRGERRSRGARPAGSAQRSGGCGG